MMKKYKLVIPNTIKKENAHRADSLRMFDGKILDKIETDGGVRFECGNLCYNSSILSDWLTEIEYEKPITPREWINNNINKYWGPSLNLTTESQFGAYAFESGERNERLRLQPLINAVSEYEKSIQDYGAANYCYEIQVIIKEFLELNTK